MNYKKSILSVVLWFVYAIIVGTGMVGTAMAVTLPAYGALIITGVWLAVTGLAVFLLHRFLEKTKPPIFGRQTTDKTDRGKPVGGCADRSRHCTSYRRNHAV